MSTSIKTVEFERREAHLSELADGPPWTVHGVALGAGDVTVGQSGVKKLWPADELKKSAESLEGTSLVVDHNNDSQGVVGQVTKAGYKDSVGVIYEAELFDEDLAEKINNGLLEVSIRGKHVDVDEMEENEEGAKVVQDIEFANLSIVPTGAAPSNTVEMGEAEELSVAELAAFTESLESASRLAEIEPGMWVTNDDMHGITISAIEDGEVEVDIYEKSDGKWRSTGETKMVSVDSLTEWDVDEEDIGEMQDEDESDEEEAAAEKDKVQWDSSDGQMMRGVVVDRQSEGCFEERLDGDEKVCAGDGDPVLLIAAVEKNDSGKFKRSGRTLALRESQVEETDFSMLSKHKMDPDVEDDEESETAKHHHQVAAEMVSDFLEVEGNSRETLVSAFLEWADDENVRRAVDEFVSKEGMSLESSIAEFEDWLDTVLPDEDDEAEMRSEGEEQVRGDDVSEEEFRDQQPERFIDEDEEELQDFEFHTPDWSGTTESDWSSPDMEDFDTDNLEEIDDHFLISATGFPPDNFSDLKLPVVEPNGDLNVNALSAVKGGRGVSAVDGLSDSMESDIIDWVNETANSEFDRNWGQDEEEAAQHESRRPRTIDDTGEEEGVAPSGPVEISLELINKYLRIEGNHERDSIDGMLSWLFSSTDLPMDTVNDFRLASRRFLDETPGTDSFDGVTVEQFRDWLLMHGDKSQGEREMREQQRGELPPIATPVHVLTGDDFWQVDKTRKSELDDITNKVTTMTDEDIEEKLAELSEPVAVEQSDLEELQQKADRFEEMSETLEALKERTDVLDEVEREQVEELAESEDPLVIESDRFEALSDEAEQVKHVYAAALSDEMPAFDADELADRFSIEELRDKYEEQVGELEEELAPEPKSGDVDEEELEERADEEDEELEPSESEEAEAKRDELRDKILGGN